MSISISITVPIDAVQEDRGAEYLDKALRSLGYGRSVTAAGPTTFIPDEGIAPTRVVMSVSEELQAEAAAVTEPAKADEPAPEQTVRLRGKSASGSGRRTKAEIAEDDELEALAKRAGIKLDAVDEQIKEVGYTQVVEELVAFIAKKAKASGGDEPKPAISTGDERIDPQDAADEAAEKPKSDTLTLDDLRAASGRYIEAFGFKAAQADIPRILGCQLHEVADADLADAIEMLDLAHNTKTVGIPAEDVAEVVKASREEMMDAAKAWVAAKAPDDMTAAGAALIESVLGPIPSGVTNASGQAMTYWTLGSVPDDGAARAKVASAFKEAAGG